MLERKPAGVGFELPMLVRLLGDIYDTALIARLKVEIIVVTNPDLW